MNRLEELNRLIAAGKGDSPSVSVKPASPHRKLTHVWTGERLPPRIIGILRLACEQTGISLGVLMSGTQEAPAVAARRAAAHRMRDIGMSMPQIGRVLKLHHTTVMHHLRKPALSLPGIISVPPVAMLEGGIVAETDLWAI